MKARLALIALAAGALLAVSSEARALPPTAHLETGVVTAIDCATRSISIQPSPEPLRKASYGTTAHGFRTEAGAPRAELSRGKPFVCFIVENTARTSCER